MYFWVQRNYTNLHKNVFLFFFSSASQHGKLNLFAASWFREAVTGGQHTNTLELFVLDYFCTFRTSSELVLIFTLKLDKIWKKVLIFQKRIFKKQKNFFLRWVAKPTSREPKKSLKFVYVKVSIMLYLRILAEKWIIFLTIRLLL